MEGLQLKVIATIHTDFPVKFGIPRQSGIAEALEGQIIFEPEYRNPDAIRGLEGSSHIWIIWEFSKAKQDNWTPMVRPPRLGGNKKLGVFATRTPFRPNPLGLSCVKLERIETDTNKGPILYVKGADLLDGTPIYDIKPYIPYTDCRPGAESELFAKQDKTWQVDIPDAEKENIVPGKKDALIEILEQNPSPAYKHTDDKIYAFEFAGMHICYKVNEDTIYVTEISRL